MTDTDTDTYADADTYAVADADTDAEGGGASSRIDVLKAELADAYQSTISGLEADIERLDRQLAATTAERKRLAADLASARREVDRLTGTSSKPPPSSSGEHRCAHPGCDRSFATKQGLAMHNTRTHKPTPATRPKPDTPPTRGRCCAAANPTTTVRRAGSRLRRCATSPITASPSIVAVRRRPSGSWSPRTSRDGRRLR